MVALYTIVLGTVSLVSTLFDRTGDSGHWCARTWSRLILKTTGVRVSVRGFEHLDPGRSYVFAGEPSEHLRHPDRVRVDSAAAPDRREGVARDGFPFLGWHLHRTGHLLVDRKNPGADIVQKMRRLVSESHSLIVFPEGTRSVDGRVGPVQERIRSWWRSTRSFRWSRSASAAAGTS